ncbi:MAG: serine/threonine protein kinase [Planctomycetota bacterium]|nr:MAG: serine/threonine protein kinase [Planctomycetota bacterium]
MVSWTKREAALAQAPHSILEQAGLASGLLTQEQIDRAWHTMVDPLRSGAHSLNDLSDEVLGQRLVELGFLNRWQAEQLRHGRTKFTLGPYRILDAIGHGGMGYVFKGEHVLLGRIEAIKVLPKSQMDPASVAAFCREIRSQAQLDHPNLVRLSFADKEGETYFLVTEYVPGSDLRRLVRHHGPLTEQQAAVVISQAAEALAYAHERGLVHRDVKPGNLLVTPEGRTKLTDLGLAAFSSDAAPASEAGPRHIVGTPDFIAPEAIISPGDVRRSSDIYSLGCTLYYAVTGKVPYPGGSTRDKLQRHLEESPITPLRFAPHLDPELMELIAAMMRKKPDERIASAQEVVARLRRWMAAASENTWKQIGQYAAEPGEPSLTAAPLADTIVVEADQVDTGEQTPARRSDATKGEPFAGLPAEVAETIRRRNGGAPGSPTPGGREESAVLPGLAVGFWPAAVLAALILAAVAGFIAYRW